MRSRHVRISSIDCSIAVVGVPAIAIACGLEAAAAAINDDGWVVTAFATANIGYIEYVTAGCELKSASVGAATLCRLLADCAVWVYALAHTGGGTCSSRDNTSSRNSSNNINSNRRQKFESRICDRQGVQPLEWCKQLLCEGCWLHPHLHVALAELTLRTSLHRTINSAPTTHISDVTSHAPIHLKGLAESRLRQNSWALADISITRGANSCVVDPGDVREQVIRPVVILPV